MTDRATILKQFGLEDRETFDIELGRDAYDTSWRILVRHDGDPTFIFGLDQADLLRKGLEQVDSKMSHEISAALGEVPLKTGAAKLPD